MTTRKWRAQRYEEQGGRCVYCGREMDPNAGLHDPLRATIDHVISRRDGGPDTFENVVAACLHCNRHKRAHTVQSLRRMADVMERLIQERGL